MPAGERVSLLVPNSQLPYLPNLRHQDLPPKGKYCYVNTCKKNCTPDLQIGHICDLIVKQVIFSTMNLSHWPCSKLSDLLSSFISSLLPFSPYTCINICASVPAPFVSDVKIHSDHGYSTYQREREFVSVCINSSMH